MTLRVLDPMGDLAQAPGGRPMRAVEGLEGLRVGMLWGMHAASVKFWPVLEKVIEEQFHPSEIIKIYKKSTWNPSPDEEIQELARKIDYAIIGVGA